MRPAAAAMMVGAAAASVCNCFRIQFLLEDLAQLRVCPSLMAASEQR